MGITTKSLYFKHVGFFPPETEQVNTLTDNSLGCFIHYLIRVFIHSFNYKRPSIKKLFYVTLYKIQTLCSKSPYVPKGEKKS